MDRTPSPSNPTRRVAAVRVELVRERSVVYPGGSTRVASPDDLARVMRAFIGAIDREVLAVAHLSTKNTINALEIVATGGLNVIYIAPREVFRGALVAGAAAIALAHQHPSGLCEPSPEDITLTRQLLLAGEVLGIKVLDHCVIGDPDHTSIRETSGLWTEYPYHR